MARLRDIIQRNTRVLQPAATAVDVGTLYYVTDESRTERSNGTSWESYTDAPKFTVGVTIDGRGAALTTGQKGYRSIQTAGVITKVRLLADQTGSIVFDIWKDTFANYPPTVADTITASAIPTISSGIKDEDTTLTGWTTIVSAGDVLGFNIDSITDITRIHLEIEITL